MTGRAFAAARTVHVEPVMGTVVSIDIRGNGDHTAALRDAVAWFHRVDERFSPYREDSEVSRHGRGEIAEEDLSADLVEVIDACDTVAALTGGAFSATRLGRFDPSAFVKGWSVDRAVSILTVHGCDTWSINAGGDVRVASSDPARAPWRIGVQHPFDRDAVAMVLHARETAVATSGRYERGDHLHDPRSGTAATGVASTTVCGPDLGFADAYATAAFVLGEDGPAWVATVPGYECWSVFDDGRVVATEGFPRVVHGVPLRTAAARDLLAMA